MAFQIIELEADAKGNITKRKPVPHPFDTRNEAVARIESTISHYGAYGYDERQDLWWAVALNGDRMEFIIEEVTWRFHFGQQKNPPAEADGGTVA
jgi:hypothetical protein